MVEKERSYRNLFGRAFLLHLKLGDMEMARLFAKAFLLEAHREEVIEAVPESASP